MVWARRAAAWALILVLVAVDTEAGDWPMLGHDAGRSGGTEDTLQPPFARKWYRLFPDEGLQSGVQPVIAEGKVFVGTLRQTLHAIDAETGRDAWQFDAGAPILHSAAVADGKVFFGTADGSVYALDSRDGKLVWRTRTGAAIWNAPVVHPLSGSRGGDTQPSTLNAQLLFIGSRDGRLYALETSTGKARWTADIGAPILNSPAVDAKLGRVYVGSETMRVHAFALESGREVWRSEPLPGFSMRGYHPVIAPDGSVLITTAPVIGYDRFQELLLEMVRAVFGDFASWRHKKEENDRLRKENFELLKKPETYQAQLDFLRQRLTADPQFQTFFVLDPETGRQRFVAPIVASESMNGPGAPPLVTREGRVIVKYQVLLRSRYEHYSPFLNVGYLDTRTGHIEPIMDQSRTYGWHDSLLLVHDEQCQLSFAGHTLLNTHQDNVNALDLESLKGHPEPWALNVHEPAPGEALAKRIRAWRGQDLLPGKEWLIRGTAVYGGGSVLDVPIAIAGDSFYYVPTHELNSGCVLIAYKSTPGAPSVRAARMEPARLEADDWNRVQELAWDWDTLETPRLKNLLEALPGPVPGTTRAPLNAEAEKQVAAITDAELDKQIWMPAIDLSPTQLPERYRGLAAKLQASVKELIGQQWRPLVTPAAKAPEHAYRFFNDPSETVYTLLLALPYLDAGLRGEVEAYLGRTIDAGLPRTYPAATGAPREPYQVPSRKLQIADEFVRDDLARCYPLWLWSSTKAGTGFAQKNWKMLRPRLQVEPGKIVDDCGNGRVAGLIGYCRLAKAAGDDQALNEVLPITRRAMRERLVYELAHTRGGVIRNLPNGRGAFARWRRLTPEVARLVEKHARPVEQRLMGQYVEAARPGWWLAWNVEQMMRNEAPCQLPTTPLEIFTARALILNHPATELERYLDLPWCRGDEFYIQKIALTLRAGCK